MSENDPSHISPELEFQPGQSLPLFASRDGAPVVVICASEYRELLALRARVARDEIRAVFQERKGPPHHLSTVDKDPEVADFLRDLFQGRMTIAALHLACVERFGEARAPSATRIGVYRKRWRSY
jgi:hypothetical protein